MADMGINGTILNILKEYYTDNVAYAKIGNELSDPIQVTKGLRQGCSLFPILFNIYLDQMRERTHEYSLKWYCSK